LGLRALNKVGERRVTGLFSTSALPYQRKHDRFIPFTLGSHTTVSLPVMCHRNVGPRKLIF